MGPLIGCSTAPPAPVVESRLDAPDVYRVVHGDTLYSIAFRYDLDYEEVARWNRLKSPDLIYAGQVLRLTPLDGSPRLAAPPPVRKVEAKPRQQPRQALAAVSTAEPASNRPEKTRPQPPARPLQEPTPKPVQIAKAEDEKPAAAPPVEQRKVAGLAWIWPTAGKVVSTYEPNIPGRKGIQIGGNPGQSIKAASPGQVVYSGSGLPGYGRLIIVKHSDSLLSAYGYLGNIFVKEGDRVKSGQTIAELGASKENRPVLHFEIRQNGKPVNPLKFLPS